VALRAELERPALPQRTTSGAVDVARAYVERLTALRESDSAGRAEASADLAAAINARVSAQLESLGSDLAEQFRVLDPGAWSKTYRTDPPDERATWWYAQIVRAARQADFFANLAGGTWWTQLKLVVTGRTLRYVVVTQKVGRGETGVLALTVFAELVPGTSGEPEAPSGLPVPLLDRAESVTFVHSDDLEVRWPEVSGVLDATTAAAVEDFAKGLA
jgi:hypothetical protein